MTSQDIRITRLDRKLELIQRKKEVYNKKKEIKQLKKSMKSSTSTTKMIVGFIFINCSAVEIYSMVAMWMLNDLSALYSLITAVIGESIAFAVYAAKAYHETKQEALIGLEHKKLSFEYEEDPNQDSSSSNTDEDK